MHTHVPKKMSYQYVIFSVLIGCSFAQKWGFGSCSSSRFQVTVKEDFELSKYLGTWYEYGSIPAWFQRGLKCVKATYSVRDDGKINVFNEGLKVSDDSVSSITGTAYVRDATEPAKLRVRFSRWSPWGKYWIADTDYDSYALVWSCSSFFFIRLEFAWILSREKEPDVQQMEDLIEKGRQMGISVNAIRKSDQSC